MTFKSALFALKEQLFFWKKEKPPELSFQETVLKTMRDNPKIVNDAIEHNQVFIEIIKKGREPK